MAFRSRLRCHAVASRFVTLGTTCAWRVPSLTFSTMASEEAKAAAAEAPAKDELTIFDKMVTGDIPCTKVYEDEQALAFRDIAPVTPTHILVIPKAKDGLTQISKMDVRHKELVGHLMYVATQVAEAEGLKNGYRLVINDGKEGCQSVYTLHIHVLGGKALTWPPGV